MRPNKYLYIVPLGDDEHSIIFNGLNKEFFSLKQDTLSSLTELISNPNVYTKSHSSILQRLAQLQFIVDDEFDEQEFLRTMRERYIHAKEYKTTILPTYECNYACWYCFQKHEPIKLDVKKIELIIKHIKKYLIEKGIEDYVLSWFGGEPLTQAKTIEYVSNNLLDFCRGKNINFSSGITTNGALLNIDNIKMLQRCNVNFYQIAIDGDEATHNKNKFDKLSTNSFQLILSNIVCLLQTNNDSCVVLRINYTLSTLKSKTLIHDIEKYIPIEYRNRIKVDLQKVWQIKEQNVPITLLRELQRKIVESGFELSTEHIFSMCYVEKEHYNMIFYNGGVEKCDKRPLNKLRGYIDDDGTIIWKKRPTFQDYDLFDSSCICNNCKYYPLCYCGCPVLREERIQENDNKVVCGHHGDFTLFQMRIQDFCSRVLNNKSLKR